MRYLIALSVLLTFSWSALSQTSDSLGFEPNWERDLYVTPMPRYGGVDHYVAIRGGYNGTRNSFWEFDVGFHNFISGCAGFAGMGIGAGFERNVKHDIWAPKAYLSMHGYILGLDVNFIQYRQGDLRQFVLRPEVGLNMVFFSVMYGYGIYWNSPIEHLNRHSLSVRVTLPLGLLN